MRSGYEIIATIEDGELEKVPISSTNIADVIDYRGYDSDTMNALMYLEKKQIIYVKDLKRLGIKLNYNYQYIRFIKQIGKISGSPAAQTRNGLWYVAKKDPSQLV